MIQANENCLLNPRRQPKQFIRNYKSGIIRKCTAMHTILSIAESNLLVANTSGVLGTEYYRATLFSIDHINRRIKLLPLRRMDLVVSLHSKVWIQYPRNRNQALVIRRVKNIQLTKISII